MRTILTAALALGVAALAAPASAQVLMSCEVEAVRGTGENTEVVYSRNCRPVTAGGDVRVDTAPNGGIRITYSGPGGQAAAGGPLYIMRFGDETTERHNPRYGAPLDGNPGTAGR